MLLVMLGVAGCHRTDDPDPTDPVDTSEPTTPTTDTDTDPPTGPEPDAFALTVDPELTLLVHATFTGPVDAWVEYRFETDDWLVAPTVDTGEAVILGLPADTRVEARAAAIVDGATVYSASATATTGSLPPGLLLPAVTVYDPSLASSARYAMVSVATGDFTYAGPYYLEIFDRDGRIVWYHEVRDGLFSFQPGIAFDGTHIWFEAEDIFGFVGADPSVTRQTLDGRWKVEWPLPFLGQAIAEGPDDAFFYELRSNDHGVNRIDAQGVTTVAWDCDAHMASIGRSGGECLLNTCNWDPSRNTILASQFETSTVFEVDVATGDVLRQMGQISSGDPYRFDPPESEFAYQHFPHWTADKTLLVSTHVPCGSEPNCNDNSGQYGIQLASEYTVNDATRTLTRIGYYQSTDLWATQVGEAWRVPNGNLVQGYGQDGAVREVTPDGEVAWQAEWTKDNSGYRVIGHLSLIDDLYPLNVGR